jgi:hypothetical protein
MPNGTEVLVAVDLIPRSVWASASERGNLGLHVRVFAADSGGGSSTPRQVMDMVTTVPIPDVNLSVIAGAPDPNDPTHFIIPIDFDFTQRRGVIDGWLRNDGVTFDTAYPAEATTRASRRLPASPD